MDETQTGRYCTPYLLQVFPFDAHCLIGISNGVPTSGLSRNKIARGIGTGKEALSVLFVWIACCCCCHRYEQVSHCWEVVDDFHGSAKPHFIKLMAAQVFAACHRFDACK